MISLYFDKIYYSDFEDNTIEYGVKFGNSQIVLIRVGFEGGIYGYENKYLKIAEELNKQLGYTVIVSSNPSSKTNPLDNAFEIINKIEKENNIEKYVVYYVGYSNGAMIGSRWGYMYQEIEKMLLINSPIMYNWLYQKDGLAKSKAKDIQIIYSEKDQSIGYLGLVRNIMNKNINIKIIEKADHMFTDMVDEFIKCVVDYFK